MQESEWSTLETKNALSILISVAVSATNSKANASSPSAMRSFSPRWTNWRRRSRSDSDKRYRAEALRPGHFLSLFSRSVPCRRLPATMITISRIIKTIAACEL